MHSESYEECELHCVLTANELGEIVSANARACEAFGYALDDLRGRNLSCLMPAPFSDHHQHFVDRFLATGEARVLDKRNVVNMGNENRAATSWTGS